METNNNNKPKYTPPSQPRDGLSRQNAGRNLVQDTSASRPPLVRQDSIIDLTSLLKEFDIHIDLHEDTSRPIHGDTGSLRNLHEADDAVSKLPEHKVLKTKNEIKTLGMEIVDLGNKISNNSLDETQKRQAIAEQRLMKNTMYTSLKNMYPKLKKKKITQLAELLIEHSK